MDVCKRRMTATDRAVIEVRLRDGWGVRAMARALDRPHGSISGEISRHGGLAVYRAEAAQRAAEASRGRSIRKPRLAADGPLFASIAELLRQGWSPEQIAGRRKRTEEGQVQRCDLQVSHEAIYAALYALPRGELRRELIACLRQDKPARGRKPKGTERRGKLRNMTNIRERPEDIEGRLVPGHWEGDLIIGARNASAIGTLVERRTRYLLLVAMPTCKAAFLASAFAGALNTIPAPLRQTLTYDQGKEMAQHEDLAKATGMKIFFADPHSPWQRGSNENTNGLLRQYFPKGMSFAKLTQAELDVVAAKLNARPRKTLDYDTPNERFTSLLASLTGKTEPPPEGGHLQT